MRRYLAKRALRPGLIIWVPCCLFALIFALTYPGRPVNGQDLATWLTSSDSHSQRAIGSTVSATMPRAAAGRAPARPHSTAPSIRQ